MSDPKPTAGDAGISTRTMEIAVAAILFALGALVVFDSVRLGAGWADDGPQSGYFPFYIGLLLCISSVATLAQLALAEWKRRDQFHGALVERRTSGERTVLRLWSNSKRRDFAVVTSTRPLSSK